MSSPTIDERRRLAIESSRRRRSAVAELEQKYGIIWRYFKECTGYGSTPQRLLKDLNDNRKSTWETFAFFQRTCPQWVQIPLDIPEIVNKGGK